MKIGVRGSLTACVLALLAFSTTPASATAPPKQEVKSTCEQSGGSYSSGSNYARCEYSNGSYTCNYDVDQCETCINGNCTVETKRPGRIPGLRPKANTLAPPSAPGPAKPAPAKPAPAVKF